MGCGFDRGGSGLTITSNWTAESDEPGDERSSPVGAGSDRDLARRFVSGDAAALHELYVRFTGPVFTVAMSGLADRGLAEEAVQDTFVMAWRAAASFDGSIGRSSAHCKPSQTAV